MREREREKRERERILLINLFNYLIVRFMYSGSVCKFMLNWKKVYILLKNDCTSKIFFTVFPFSYSL